MGGQISETFSSNTFLFIYTKPPFLFIYIFSSLSPLSLSLSFLSGFLFLFHFFLSLSLCSSPPPTKTLLQLLLLCNYISFVNHNTTAFFFFFLLFVSFLSMSGLYNPNFSPARAVSPQIRSTPDVDRYMPFFFFSALFFRFFVFSPCFY